MSAERVQPGHWEGEKAEFVRDLFADIAPRYDLLNTILSFNRHRAWRRQAVRLAGLHAGDRALDVCAGTGDFALELYRVVGRAGTVVGVDFCSPMVQRGQAKTDSLSGGRIVWMTGDATCLPCRDSFFDAATVGFGIRNVADAPQAFREMARVVRPGGRILCLEFNRPRSRFWRALCDLYETKLLPRIGGLLSRKEAYSYLQASIQAFHTREEVTAMMERAGITDVRVHDLNFGSVCIHAGTKP